LQVEQKRINDVTKEITLIVEAERAEKNYQKQLQRLAARVQVPGFRKGKAPLNRVEKMFAYDILDQSYKTVVDETFKEAANEHDIHYVGHPEVKDIKWERGEEMTIVLEVELEPDVQITQWENLRIPYTPIDLDAQVQYILKQLVEENSTLEDVEQAQMNDLVVCELNYKLDQTQIVETVAFWAGDAVPKRSLPELLDARIGDSLELNLSGEQLKLVSKNPKPRVADATLYPCTLMVNSILRRQVPALDDEFAKKNDYESLEELQTEIADNLRLKVEHQNIDRKHKAITWKLFQDNKFELPSKTMDRIAEEEKAKLSGKPNQEYYEYIYRTQITMSMISMFIWKALRKLIPLEITEEQRNEYIEHLAILEDITPEAYKESNKDELKDPNFDEQVLDYQIGQRLVSLNEFYIEEKPESEDTIPNLEPEETDFEDQEEEQA